MWKYERKLLYPINIKKPNPKLAQIIISQYGGPYCKCLSKTKRQLFILKNKKENNYNNHKTMVM